MSVDLEELKKLKVWARMVDDRNFYYFKITEIDGDYNVRGEVLSNHDYIKKGDRVGIPISFCRKLEDWEIVTLKLQGII